MMVAGGAGLALTALALAGPAGPAAAQRAGQLAFDEPADALAMNRKMQCSTVDGRPQVFHWSGRVYARVPGEPDRHLWNVEGMNIRACGAVAPDPQRGAGHRMVSREIMIYLDPATGRIVDDWTNPWTGAGNRIFHVANDPVNMPPMRERAADGAPARLPVRAEDGRVFWNIEVPLFYTNPLAGDYQAYAGGHYHAMEIFNFVADERPLRDRRVTEVNPTVSWVRLSQWLPFMEMGSRPGGLVFNATGQKVAGVDALPAVLVRAIDERWPQYRQAPPLNDDRPNATTWTEFRRLVDEERAAGRRPSPGRAGH